MRIYKIQNCYSQTNFSAKKGNKKHNTPSPEYGYGTQSDLAVVVAKILNADDKVSENTGESSAEIIPAAVIMTENVPPSESSNSCQPKLKDN